MVHRWVVGATPDQINLAQLHSHTNVVGVGGIVCLQIGGFMVHRWCRRGGGDGDQMGLSFFSVPVVAALSPARWWSREDLSRSTCRRLSVLVIAGRWCTVGSWLEVDGSDSLLRRHRAGVSVLKFDGVSGGHAAPI